MAHRCSGCDLPPDGRQGGVSGGGGEEASRATGGPVAPLWMLRVNSPLKATGDRERCSLDLAGKQLELVVTHQAGLARTIDAAVPLVGQGVGDRLHERAPDEAQLLR